MASEMETEPEVPEEPSNHPVVDTLLRNMKETFGQMDFLSVFGGAALAIGFLALAGPINESASLGFLNHELSPVFVTLYVALSTGHYLGLAITGSGSNFVDGVFGMFLVLSAAVVYWSVTTGMSVLPIALLGIILGLVMAHHRGWVRENEWVEVLVNIFGKGIVPFGAVIGITAEIALPLISSTQIDEFLNSLDPLVQAGVLFVIAGALYAISNLLD